MTPLVSPFSEGSGCLYVGRLMFGGKIEVVCVLFFVSCSVPGPHTSTLQQTSRAHTQPPPNCHHVQLHPPPRAHPLLLLLLASAQEVEETREERLERERREREAEQQSEFERIQAERRRLPMFPYRHAGAYCCCRRRCGCCCRRVMLFRWRCFGGGLCGGGWCCRCYCHTALLRASWHETRLHRRWTPGSAP